MHDARARELNYVMRVRSTIRDKLRRTPCLAEMRGAARMGPRPCPRDAQRAQSKVEEPVVRQTAYDSEVIRSFVVWIVSVSLPNSMRVRDCGRQQRSIERR